MTGNDSKIVEARVKLADRPIVWEEAYTKRSLFLKKQFHEVLGPGSYFRFEGRDSDTGDEYFAVVSPADIHSPKEEFFAGVRKLPSDYAAGGLYFHDLKEAFEYASNTWGIPVPQEMRYYDSKDLKGIGEKIQKWKDASEDFEKDEDYLEKWYQSIKKSEGGKIMSNSDTNQSQFVYVRSDSYPFFQKVAMPTWLRHEVNFTWWDLDDAIARVPSFVEAAERQPSLIQAMRFANHQRSLRVKSITKNYGEDFIRTIGIKNLYKVFLVNSPDRGTYIVFVGPYCSIRGRNKEYFQEAKDKFSVYTWKLNVASNEEIDKMVRSLIQEYAEKYQVALTPEDIDTSDVVENPVGEVTIGKSGREKIYGSPEWKKQMLDRYGVKAERGMNSRLKDCWKVQNAIWREQLEEAYKISQETGEAFERSQPPPPRTSLKKESTGQRQPTSIYREKISPEDKGLSADEKIEKYGFDSIIEAVQFLNSNSMPGAPIGDLPTTTTADLAAARKKRDMEIEMGIAETPASETVENQPEVENPKDEKIVMQKPRKTPIKEVEKEKPQVLEPAKEKARSQHDDFEGDFVVSRVDSIKKMIKMAEELDKKGKYQEAEEIHNILKKHLLDR